MSVSEASAISESSASPHSQRSNELALSSWPSRCRDLFFFAVSADLLVELGGLVAVVPHGSELVLGPLAMAGHSSRGACGVGEAR